MTRYKNETQQTDPQEELMDKLPIQLGKSIDRKEFSDYDDLVSGNEKVSNVEEDSQRHEKMDFSRVNSSSHFIYNDEHGKSQFKLVQQGT